MRNSFAVGFFTAPASPLAADAPPLGVAESAIVATTKSVSAGLGVCLACLDDDRGVAAGATCVPAMMNDGAGPELR